MQVFGLVLTPSAVMCISIGRKMDTTWEAVPLISAILTDVCSYLVKKRNKHLERWTEKGERENERYAHIHQISYVAIFY